jgi:DNA replication protein DnaC
MTSLLLHSGIPEYLWDFKPLRCVNLDVKPFERLAEIKKDIFDWVEYGNNLYPYSEICGNGKTSWATQLMFSYFDKVWHFSALNTYGIFVNVPNFLYNSKRAISQDMPEFEHLCEQIETASLVIWDDLPSTQATSYEHQLLLQYIDGRLNRGLSNIFTGNQDRENCNKYLGTRLTSRIFGCSEVIEFREGDKRKYGRTPIK